MGKSKKPLKIWLTEEREIFKVLWNNPKIMKEDILKVLVDRTWQALMSKASIEGYPTYGEVRKAKINREYYKELLRVIELD